MYVFDLSQNVNKPTKKNDVTYHCKVVLFETESVNHILMYLRMYMYICSYIHVKNFT